MKNYSSHSNRLLLSVTLGLILCLWSVPFAKAAETSAVLHQGKNVKVLPLGDSITLGKNEGLGGYRRVLYEWLLDGGYKITYVGKQNLIRHGPPTCSDGSIAWHEGYGSFRTDMILDGGKAEKQSAPPLAATLATFTPDVVLVMLGTNDILQSYQLETLEARFEKILQTIYTANAETVIVVATLPPIKRKDWADKNERAIAYNAALAELVKKHAALGRKIVLADTYAAFGRHSLNSADKVHPSTLGYAQMAQVLYRTLTGEDAPIINRANPVLLPPVMDNEPDK